MASVHLKQRSDRKSSPYWYASFRGADGRQYFKSTKKTKRAEALPVAMEFERLARGQQTEAHYRRVAAEIYEHSAGKPLNFHTCKQWLESWLQNCAATVDSRTLETYESTIRDFREFLGEHRAGAPLGSITAEEITSFRDELLGRRLAPSTINNRIRKVLSLPFEEARRRGYVTVNPCAAVKGIKESTPKSKRIRKPFSPEQVAALFNAVRSGKWKDQGWEGVILCGMTTALRLREITNMTWGQLDLKKLVILVDPEKKDDTLQIPLHPDFAKWLAAQDRGIAKAPVFPDLHGRTSGGANGLSRIFQRIMDAANVVGEITRQGAEADERKKLGTRAGRTVKSLTFHCLRHTATSLMANAGVAPETRMAITGHTDDRVHAGYTHHELKTLREAVNKIAVPQANVK